MPERLIPELIQGLLKYKEALLAIVIGLVGGGLSFLSDVKNGKRKWDLTAFLLAASSAGFLTPFLYIVCVDLFQWTAGLSLACSGIVSHMGADRVQKMLVAFFSRKFQ
ncbi:phage holin family protein [Marinobacter oulmenensis]|uniref:LydA holin phage, holin superfamily III n=1 Tax=Marinobacter oulmenensis TaxID=643747 RepID=A0A840UBD6_9GAMM|nr:phage holin family protein [Marinobacter oulmenensis]MBB5322322.1 hypothetical protein [Marinobacter oulmenensis]